MIERKKKMIYINENMIEINVDHITKTQKKIEVLGLASMKLEMIDCIRV